MSSLEHLEQVMEREGLTNLEILARSIQRHPNFITEEDPSDPVLRAAIVLDRIADDKAL